MVPKVTAFLHVSAVVGRLHLAGKVIVKNDKGLY